MLSGQAGMDGVELLRIESERPAEGPVVRIQQIGVVRRTENRLPEGCGVPAEAPVRLAEEFTCPEYPAAVDGNPGWLPRNGSSVRFARGRRERAAGSFILRITPAESAVPAAPDHNAAVFPISSEMVDAVVMQEEGTPEGAAQVIDVPPTCARRPPSGKFPRSVAPGC